MHNLHNWREEKGAAYLYHLISERETDPTRKKLFIELEQAAEKQAQIWEEKFRHDSNQVLPTYHPDGRTRFVAILLKIFGTKQLRFILSAMKVRGMSIYDTVPHGHQKASAHLEQRHKGINTAGNLRAAVFGVNDGLVSNASLLLGMVGAAVNHNIIILSGIAGLLAGACSMAAGEYVSMRSQREFFEYQIQLEKEELELYPEEEAAELASIYRARGLPKDEAKKMANFMISNPKTALDTLAREELGLNPNELGSPWGAAIASFISFAFGAFIPLLPFLLRDSFRMIFWSIGISATTLVVIGGLLSLYTNRSAILGGLRMLLIGCMAGVVTFFIGHLLHVIL